MHVKILSGIPGSGKSTYAQKFREEQSAAGRLVITVSADRYHMRNDRDGLPEVYDFKPENVPASHAYCLRAFVDNVSDPEIGSRVIDFLIVDNTNTTTTELAPYVALAAAYGHTCEIVTFFPVSQKDLGEVACRNVHSVPRQVVENMFVRLMARVLPKHWAVTETQIPVTFEVAA